MSFFIMQPITVPERTEMVFMIIWEMFHERISLNLLLLQLLLNFMSVSSDELLIVFLKK